MCRRHCAYFTQTDQLFTSMPQDNNRAMVGSCGTGVPQRGDFVVSERDARKTKSRQYLVGKSAQSSIGPVLCGARVARYVSHSLRSVCAVSSGFGAPETRRLIRAFAPDEGTNMSDIAERVLDRGRGIWGRSDKVVESARSLTIWAQTASIPRARHGIEEEFGSKSPTMLLRAFRPLASREIHQRSRLIVSGFSRPLGHPLGVPLLWWPCSPSQARGIEVRRFRQGQNAARRHTGLGLGQPLATGVEESWSR